MSKYSCDIIQDLLALYHDGVCSEDSCAAVEQHLAECEKCRETIKLLGDTELEDKITEQAGEIVKKHKIKQRRKIVVIIAVAVAVLLAVVFFWVIKPRIELNNLICEFLPEVGEGAEYFTEYDVSDDSLVTLETEVLSVDIPADYVQKDMGEIDAVVYHDSGNQELMIMVTTSETDFSDISLFYRDNYGDISDEEYETIVRYLKDWFGALGNGLPDSAYGTYKCMHLLSDDDRSFWNIGQNIAFGITGILKESIPVWGEELYIYESDDKCGFVFVAAPHDDVSYYRVTADIYSTDDLNAPHNVIIRSESVEQAYAIINSIAFN